MSAAATALTSWLPAAPPRAAAGAPMADQVRVDRDADQLRVTLRLDVVQERMPALQGHFPGFPIVPGVFMLDAVQQAAAAALQRQVRVSAVHSVRFLAPVLPGTQLVFTVTLRPANGAWAATATGEVDGAVCVRVKATVDEARP